MNEMIERVARAIFPDTYIHGGFESGSAAWADALARTRRGIETMRPFVLKAVETSRGYPSEKTSVIEELFDATLSE